MSPFRNIALGARFAVFDIGPAIIVPEKALEHQVTLAVLSAGTVVAVVHKIVVAEPVGEDFPVVTGAEESVPVITGKDGRSISLFHLASAPVQEFPVKGATAADDHFVGVVPILSRTGAPASSSSTRCIFPVLPKNSHTRPVSGSRTTSGSMLSWIPVCSLNVIRRNVCHTESSQSAKLLHFLKIA